MSTIDTSTWSPDTDLNDAIEGIPLNADSSVAETWKAIRALMAAHKGDAATVMTGASANSAGASGLVPAPSAGDQNKVLKGDATWGTVAAANHVHGNITNDGKVGTTSGLPLVTGTGGAVQAGSFGSSAGTFCEGNDSRLSNARTPTSHTHGSITNDGKLGTASRAVVTDSDKKIAVSSVTSTELGYLSGVTSALQTQIDAKLSLSGGTMTGAITRNGNLAQSGSADGSIYICNGTGASGGGGIWLYGKDSAQAGEVRLQTYNGTYRQLRCLSDGTLIWNGQPVQTSSDERLKTPMSDVPDAVLDAWESVRWGQFRFLDAVDRKGEAARFHLGLIAQRVKTIFEERGLDACVCGILCYDNENDLWMIRYEEALAMEAVCQRRRADRLEARIVALEEAQNG